MVIGVCEVYVKPYSSFLKWCRTYIHTYTISTLDSAHLVVWARENGLMEIGIQWNFFIVDSSCISHWKWLHNKFGSLSLVEFWTFCNLELFQLSMKRHRWGSDCSESFGPTKKCQNRISYFNIGGRKRKSVEYHKNGQYHTSTEKRKIKNWLLRDQPSNSRHIWFTFCSQATLPFVSD